MPGQGGPKYTTVRQDRRITQNARRGTTISGRRVSVSTIRNRLHEDGLVFRKPLRRVPLTDGHRQDGVRWAREGQLWVALYSDQFRYGLHNNS